MKTGCRILQRAQETGLATQACLFSLTHNQASLCDMIVKMPALWREGRD
jgi:hypothetical protein